MLLMLSILLACSGGGGEGGGDWGEQGEPEPARDPRALVEAEPVARGSVGAFIVSNGLVESEDQATLVPEATGTVIAIHAEEGDLVRRGQLLAVIENASLDAGLARAEAEQAKAEAELERVRGLHGKGAVSDRDLADAQYAYDAARTAMVEARGTESHTRLVSPIAGTVASRDLRYGEVAGGQPAFTVVDLNKLRVLVQLPERDLATLAVGQPAILSSVYDEEARVEGVVQRISPTVDPATGTVRVTVDLDRDQTLLRPGQFVSVRIETGRHEDVLVVQRSSVLYEEGSPLVFRVRVEEEPEPEDEEGEASEEDEEDEGPGFLAGLFGGDEEDAEEEEPVEIPGPYRVGRKVPVELGLIDEDLAEVLSGVDAGDLVITIGHANLRDEARVRLPEDPRLELPEPDEDDEADDDAADAEG
jgi:membrane fusion protein (multidrug efflux system)